jgi:protein-disulfide isomerase
LSLKYPADWRIGFDQNIDFVLVGPTDTTSGESPYLLAQSGAPGPDQTFRQVMEQLASRDGATVIETTFAGVEGLRFEFQSEQADRYRITGFPSGGGDIVLLAAVAPADTWEVWGPVFDAILDGATLAPLELDAAFLDSQMQVSFEADGLLTVGDPAAPLWIVEFMDFSCSHCANYRAAIDRLAQDYVQTGKARLTLVVLDVIGLEPSALAATYQFCGAKQGVGWRIHEAIFGVFDRGQAYTDENLSAAVQNADLGLDLEAYGACLRDEAIHAIVAANDAWADSVGVDSTPTVMIGAQKDDLRFMLDSNGEKLAGEIPLYFVYGKLDEQLASLAPQPTPIRRLIGG